MQDGHAPSLAGMDDGLTAPNPGWYFARRRGDPALRLEIVSVLAEPPRPVEIAVLGEAQRLAPEDFAWLMPVFAPSTKVTPLPTSLDVLGPGDYAASLARHLRDAVTIMTHLGYDAPSAGATIRASVDGVSVEVDLHPAADVSSSTVGTGFTAGTVRWMRRALVRRAG